MAFSFKRTTQFLSLAATSLALLAGGCADNASSVYIDSAIPPEDDCTIDFNTENFRQVGVWDPARTEPLRLIPTPRMDRLTDILTDTRAESMVVVGRRGEDLLASAWDGRRWRPLRGFESRHALAMGPAGKRIIGLRGELGTAVWELGSSAPASPLPYRSVYQLVRQDSALLAGDLAGRVVLHDIEKQMPLVTVQTRPGLRSAVVSQDGLRLVAAGLDGETRRLGLWAVEDGKARFERSQEDTEPHRIHWNAAGSHLQFEVGLHRLSVATLTGRLDPQRSGPAAPGVKGISDIGRVRTGTHWMGRARPDFEKRDLLMVDDVSGELMWSVRAKRRIRSAAVSSDGAQVALLERGGQVRVFAVSDGSRAAEWTTEDPIVALTSHPRKLLLIAIHRSGLVATHELETGEIRWSVALGKKQKRAPRVAISPDAKVLALGSGRTVISLEIETSKRAEFQVHGRVRNLAVAPNGRRIAVSDGTDLAVWNPANGQLVAQLIPLPQGQLVVRSGRQATLSAGAKPWVRWRRGFDHIPRNASEIGGLFESWTAGDIPL